MTNTTLIRGANKGLGRETARRLLAEGHEVFDTNVFGAVRVTHAFLPLLERSAMATLAPSSPTGAFVDRNGMVGW